VAGDTDSIDRSKKLRDACLYYAPSMLFLSSEIRNKTFMKNSAPRRLSPEAKKLWRAIVEEFEINDSAGLLLLENALEAFDEMRAGQAILAADGPIIIDRFGAKKQHPVTLVIRDARNLMLRSLKALNLDIAPDSPLKGGH
jgi:phage terminase small subunit